MPKIDILDVDMVGKILFVLEFNVFSMLLCWKIIYVYFKKLLANILFLRKNAGKTFTESCNNPVFMFFIHNFTNESISVSTS